MKRIVAWWRGRRQNRQNRQEAEKLLAMLVLLADSTPGSEPPPPRVQQFVNRTLRRQIY